MKKQKSAIEIKKMAMEIAFYEKLEEATKYAPGLIAMKIKNGGILSASMQHEIDVANAYVSSIFEKKNNDEFCEIYENARPSKYEKNPNRKLRVILDSLNDRSFIRKRYEDIFNGVEK